MKSYDYEQRQGFKEITWEQFDRLCNDLAESVAALQPDLVIGIARAGLFPATAVACKLRLDLYPIRVSRREADHVVREHPVWKVGVADDVAGRRAVIIDEMADSGETLEMVAAEVIARGASEVRRAALVAHSWAQPFPDVVALTSDALVIFPWDKEVFLDGRWQLHPELAGALAMQHITGRDDGEVE